MKIKYLRLSLLAILLILPIYAYSENGEVKKSSIVIFNFDYVTPDPAGTTQDRDENLKKYQYYSFIIPQTLSKNINSEGQYISSRKYDTLKISSTFSNEEERISHIKELVRISGENSADYLVSGECSIAESTLIVSVTVFNARGYDITTFEHRSSEIGVLFKDTADTISNEITQSITIMAGLDKERFRPSPFIPAYNFLRNFSIGVDGGYLFIHNPWSDFYNNTYFASPYIMLDIDSWLGFSIKYDYIQSNSDGKDFADYYEVDFRGGSLNAHLRYIPSGNLSFVFSLGGGIMDTEIIMNPGSPLMNPGMQISSKDPYLDTSLYVSLKTGSLEIKTGIIHKRIFSKGEPVQMSGIYAGFGILF